MWVDEENTDTEFSYNYDENNNESTTNNTGKKNLKLPVLIVGGLLIVFIVFFVFINNSNGSKEKRLVNAAINFVNEKGVTSSREYYIDNGLLNANIGSCSNSSGVFVNGNIYTAYLECDDYKSDILDNGEYSLNGDEVTILPVGINFVDPGVQGYNYKRIGDVGTIEGVYNLAYNVNGSLLYRKVVLIENNELLNDYPNIILSGDKNVIVYQGLPFEEPGYSAMDSTDGNITDKVIVDQRVDTSLPGEYILNYSITNSKGYGNYVTRKVVVVEKENTTITVFLSTSEKTVSDVDVTINVSGNTYKSMDIYQDGMVIGTTTENTYNVTAKDNTKYLIKAYDLDDTVTEYEVTVDNIDRSKPSGSCVVDMYYDYSLFKITDKDNKDSFSFSIDGDKSGFVSDKNYKFKTTKRGKSYSVTIKNYLGTENTINCSTNEKIYKKEYKMSNGYECLEGFECFSQGSYGSGSYSYCSTDTCGTIAKRGCSLVSSTIVLSYYKRKADGSAYNPYETIQFMRNVCSRYQSGFSCIGKFFRQFGYATSDVYSIHGNKDRALDYLRSDYQLIIRVGPGAYTSGGHLMSILTVDQSGNVYLRDTSFSKRNGLVNSFVTYEEIEKNCGSSCEWMAIGPAGANM